MKRVISRVWLLISLCFVILGVYQTYLGNPTEAIGSVYWIWGLTFPSGYAAMNITYFFLMYLYNSGMAPLDFKDIINYAAMIGAGYFQWFILVPWIVSLGKKVWQIQKRYRVDRG